MPEESTEAFAGVTFFHRTPQEIPGIKKIRNDQDQYRANDKFARIVSTEVSYELLFHGPPSMEAPLFRAASGSVEKAFLPFRHRQDFTPTLRFVLQ